MTKKLHMHSECENEIHLGKLVQMLPRHLGSLRLRVASAQVKIPAFNEIRTEITIFINSGSNPLQHWI